MDTELKDSDGVSLEIGAMYCCVNICVDYENSEYNRYDDLVRYVGVRAGRHVFADADTWDEADCDFDSLSRQASPVIDPISKGWVLTG